MNSTSNGSTQNSICLLILSFFLSFFLSFPFKMTYEAAQYVPVLSSAMSTGLKIANLSRKFGAYGIAGFLHRADIAKVV